MLRRVWIVGPNPAGHKAGGVAAHMANLAQIDHLTDAIVECVYNDLLPSFPWNLRRGLGTMRAATRILTCRNTQGLVVHLNTYLYPRTIFAEQFTIAACRIRGIPLFVQIHGGRWHLVEGTGRAESLWRWTFETADSLGVFLGPQWRELEAQGWGEKMRAVRSLLPTTDVCVASEQGPTHFLFMGRLVEEKGIGMLLDAFGTLASERDDVHLTVMGSGHLADEVRDRMHSASWSHCARYSGFVDRDTLHRQVGECNVFVLPSRYPEGFPLAFLETAEQGLAPLVTTSSAIPELFDEEREFLALQMDDPNHLLVQMRRVAEDRSLRCALGQRARQAVHRLCAIEHAGEQYISCYAEIAR